MAIPIYSPGGGGITQTTTEFLNQSSVSISHNFSHKPRVIIVDSSGEVIMGDIQYFFEFHHHYILYHGNGYGIPNLTNHTMEYYTHAIL
jgi:hypothetical protein